MHVFSLARVRARSPSLPLAQKYAKDANKMAEKGFSEGGGFGKERSARFKCRLVAFCRCGRSRCGRSGCGRSGAMHNNHTPHSIQHDINRSAVVPLHFAPTCFIKCPLHRLGSLTSIYIQAHTHHAYHATLAGVSTAV